MKHNISHFLIALSLSIFTAHTGLIGDDGTVSIVINDSSGNPLPDAVVSLLPNETIPNAAPLPIATMAQRDTKFSPHILAVPVGTVVEFPNEDEFRHHIYSFSKAKPFEVRLYGGDEEKNIKFDTAGVVALGCNIHDSMLAYIYVADTPYVGKTDKNGRITFQTTATGTYSVTFWHERMKKIKNTNYPSLNVEANSKIEKTFSMTLKRKRMKSRKKRY